MADGYVRAANAIEVFGFGCMPSDFGNHYMSALADNHFQGRKLGLIGAGNMAEALVREALAAHLFSADAVMVSDPVAARRKIFSGLGCKETESNDEVVSSADIVVLAVKPQVADQVLSALAPAGLSGVLWVSIMAGIGTARLEKSLGARARVVRVMPNTPMLVRAGAAGVAPGAHASEEDVADVVRLFESSSVVEVVGEEKLDAITALSGSGPAYFCYVVEALVEAAVAEGLEPATAHRLAVATCRGAGALMAEMDESPQELRKRVTSPGGTTAAALEVLEEKGVHAAFTAAYHRAAERSRELGKNSG